VQFFDVGFRVFSRIAAAKDPPAIFSMQITADSPGADGIQK
jgi:hypothetical protein